MAAPYRSTEEGTDETPIAASSAGSLLGWTAGLLVVGLPAVLGSSWLAALAGDRAWLFEDAQARAGAYWIPARAAELYVLLPLFALSASVLFLAPGLLLAANLGQAAHGGRWLAAGCALSTLSVSAVGALATALGHADRTADLGWGFGALVLASTAIAGLFTVWRRPRIGPHALADLAWCLLPPLALVALLAPKFLWEDFNGDGAHAFEAARLLLTRTLPFWDPEHTGTHEFPGITSFLFLYPLSWFLRLIGPLEVAARLAYVPLLALLGGVFLWAVERPAGRLSAKARRLRVGERCVLWLGLGVYSIAMAFSATYSPHNADIALPATQDTYVVAAFVAYALCLGEGRLGWALVWLLTTWFAAPNGPLLVMCAVPAWFLARWPSAWRPTLTAAAGVLVGALAARGLVLAIDVLGLPPPGDEYAGESLANRFKFLILVDWRRFLFVLLPAGVTPFLVFFTWRRLDTWARFLALVALASFAIFYVQAGVAFHHFVPAMLLPIAAFWRWRATALDDPRAPFWTLAAAAGAGVALIWVRPLDPTPRIAAQQLGATLSERSGDYATSGHAAFSRVDHLFELYPFSADERVPEESYGGSSLVWLYYARHERVGAALSAQTNVVLQGANDAPPPGFELVARGPLGALWLRERAIVDRQLAVRQPTPAGSPVFALARTTLYRQSNAQVDPRVIDVRAVLRSLGL